MKVRTLSHAMCMAVLALSAATAANAQDLFSFFSQGAAADAAPAAEANTWTTTVEKLDSQIDAGPATKPVKYAAAYHATTGAPLDSARPAKTKVTGRTHLLNGLASYYASGQVTANGEKYDKRAMTAAHKTLPFGTRVRVTRLDSGSSVIVRINDRGPFKPGRVIDLSEAAAENLGITDVGLSAVNVEVLSK